MNCQYFILNFDFQYLYENKIIPIDIDFSINKPKNNLYFQFCKELLLNKSDVKETFKKFYPKKKIDIPKIKDLLSLYDDISIKQLEYEFNDFKIQTKNVLIDPNNIFIINLTKNSELVILELLLYFVMDKLQNKSERSFIGVFIPAENEYYVYDCTLWNHEKFLLYINDTIIKIQTSLYSYYHNIKYIGTHISNIGNILNSIVQSEQQYIQMFLTSPQSAKTKIYSIDDIKNSKEYISKNKISYFTHAPYIINLCNTDIDWALKILKQQLKQTYEIGGKGVVVHLGAKKDKTEKEATEIMYKNVIDVVSYLTENKIECPLLLETSVGEGTEICWKLKDLISFYKRIIEKYDSKYIKICCDTCHIFQAGYEPSYFITQLLENKIEIPLIHYNNSVFEKGEHKDRHETIFKGKIGFIEMVKVIDIAIKNNIVLVTE